MSAQESLDYSKILTDLIQKQMVVIGPDITFAKVRKVGKITIDTNGKVLKFESPNPAELLQKLVDQFMELSEAVAKKSLESLITSYPSLHVSAPKVENHNDKDSMISPPVARNVYNPQVYDAEKAENSVNKSPVQRESVSENAPRRKIDQLKAVEDYSSIDGMQGYDIKKVTDLFRDKDAN